jgi:hypothetical protein
MEFFKGIWRDPVWSKVIATIIVGIPASMWAFRAWIFADIYLSRAQVIGWSAFGALVGLVIGAQFARTRRVS